MKNGFERGMKNYKPLEKKKSSMPIDHRIYVNECIYLGIEKEETKLRRRNSRFEKREYIRLSIDAHAAVRPDSDQTIGACLSTTGYRLTRACTATWHVKRVNNCEKDGDR